MTSDSNLAHPRYAAETLTVLCGKLFEATGMPEADATLTADSLVEADLRGVDSHGIVRMPIYLDRLAHRVIDPRPMIRTVRERRSTAVVDGGNGMGQVVAAHAMRLAIDKALGEPEPTFVAVRGSNHFGAAAWFAEMATQHGMIGLAFTIGGINHMVPWGGAEAMLGNNPFAVAIPLDGEPPLVLDMACSVAARGKIIVAAKEGRPIPADWAVDRDGRPTTDAAAGLDGFVSPVGGPKGYALTLTIGLLSTMLSGAFFGSEVTHMYDDMENPQNIGHLLGVLPIAAFEDAAVFARRMRKAADDVRGVRRAPGVEAIHLPGEREASTAGSRRHDGVPVAAEVVAEIEAWARKLDIAMPAPLA